jgi:hypothetical protein
MGRKKLSWEEQRIAEERRRKQVEVKVDCDFDRMTGSIDDAIRYLEEIRDQYGDKDVRFNVESQGYDGFDMEFFYMREEDDDSYEFRMELLERDLARKAEEERKATERMKIADEIKRLQSKMRQI